MNSVEIRELFQGFFERRGHRRLPSASLIPPPEDTSTLLTVAGMQPFKPYFLGREKPPASRLTSCQMCFRTPDIEEVGKTLRHLTFFEMLGNFSFGDYFKEEAIPFGWELSTEGFGFEADRIWITVFGGDEELGLGPDEEAIEIWRGLGVADERIVRLPRSENFWQAGPTGPCGPCSEMYLDRGESFGGPDDLPGDDTDRFLEYWNHVFMTYDLDRDGRLEPLPKKNIDTGLGLERMAAIQQGVGSVFETDQFSPLIERAESESGSSYGDGAAATRAMRIIADHSRGMAALLAEGVVPSNEDRGYVLRRIMRRAIQQGRSLGLEGEWLTGFTDLAVEIMAPAHPRLAAELETVRRWVRVEQESFGRTLDRGTELLERLIGRAESEGTSWIDAEQAFKLHDTYGFPYDLTKELLAERGLSVDDAGFEELMEGQRERARSGGGAGAAATGGHERVLEFVASAPQTRFVGYETLRATTGIGAIGPGAGGGANGAGGDGREKVLVKLEQSPFYAEGGGQVADSGTIRWSGGSAVVTDVIRVGEDQALELVPGEGTTEWPPGPEASLVAEVERETRHATMRNHTATHLLHAALRERLGEHVHQAGSAVRPDKLRFDFTHGQALSAEDVEAVEARVNEWVKGSHPVRWIGMERGEAERLGAMALFGEKYGDWVRVVEVEGVSRELCGGTHVANTAEVGIFKITGESSSAANVRRIEAVTGPAAIDLFRGRDAELDRVGELLGDRRRPVEAARKAAERMAEAGRGAKRAAQQKAGELGSKLAGEAETVAGTPMVVAEVPIGNPKALLGVAKSIRGELDGDGPVVLAGAEGGKVGMVALFGEAATARGLSAAEVIGEVAPLIGGGGGGSEEMAQAGGRDESGVEEALSVARGAIERGLGQG